MLKKRPGFMQRISQISFTVLFNGYLVGLCNGTLYQGLMKYIPCPGFNCHSCPAALFVCPIGAVQHFASYGKYIVSFYVLGCIGIIGAMAGRIVCGWACPFGFLQDMLYKIPSPKRSIPRKAESIKYVVLFGLVVLVASVTKEPWFCKLVCPAGTLEAGIPLLLLNHELRPLIGQLFVCKTCVLVMFIVWMIISKRPFCRVVCPLGAMYGLFNRISFFKMHVSADRCILDYRCETSCPVSHRMYNEDPNAERCVRCLRCSSVCPTKAIQKQFSAEKKKGK